MARQLSTRQGWKLADLRGTGDRLARITKGKVKTTRMKIQVASIKRYPGASVCQKDCTIRWHGSLRGFPDNLGCIVWVITDKSRQSFQYPRCLRDRPTDFLHYPKKSLACQSYNHIGLITNIIKMWRCVLYGGWCIFISPKQIWNKITIPWVREKSGS